MSVWVAWILAGVSVVVVLIAYWLGLPIEWASLAFGTVGGLLGVALNVTAQSISGRLDRQHQLRMAALEKRLQAHQDAYTLWRKLFMHVYQDDIVEVVKECADWWDNNCLYLEPRARKAFQRAYVHAPSQKPFLDAHENAKVLEKNWQDIEAAGEEIARAVSLPSIGELEQPKRPTKSSTD